MASHTFDVYAPKELCTPTINGESNPLFQNWVLNYVAFANEPVLTTVTQRVFPRVSEDAISFDDLFGLMQAGAEVERIQYFIEIPSADFGTTPVPAYCDGPTYDEEDELGEVTATWAHSWESWSGDEARYNPTNDTYQIPFNCGSGSGFPSGDIFFQLMNDGYTLLPWGTPDPRPTEGV